MIFLNGNIAQRLEEVNEKIAAAAQRSGRSGNDITLVAVTKTHSPDIMNEAVRCGVKNIGENKVQEIVRKYPEIDPVNWHLIGHLQTNKVKYIIDKVSLIHSVDSIKIMDEINFQAAKINRIMEILIQINISGEKTKFGIRPEDIGMMLEHAGKCGNIMVSGIMTIAPKINTGMSNRLHFSNIYKIYLDNKAKKYDNVNMKYLSMGMSGDYEDAISEGANMVRIGSSIFGQRDYKEV